MNPDATPLRPELLLEHAGWIRSLALRLVRDAATADDLVQETLLAALERKPDADRPVRPWLGRVLRNRAALRRRGERRRSEREERAARAETLPSSEELVERADQQRRVVEAVMGLGDPYRSILLLRYYEGLEPRDIARRQGRPAGTVRSQLQRGHELLRAALDRANGGDRRAWCLALVPLAAEEAVAAGVSGASLVASLAAMNTPTKLSLAAVVALVLATALYTQTPNTPEPERPDAPALAVVDELATPADLGPEPSPSVPTPRVELAGEPVVAPQPVAAALLSGIVVDPRTGEPLPEFRLDCVRDGEVVESVVTDDEGVFRTSERHAAGPWTLRQIDHRGLDRWWTFGGFATLEAEPTETELAAWEPGTEVRIEAAVGPTFAVQVVGPRELANDELELRLRSDAPMEPAWRARAPLRGEGDERWVRFHALLGRLPVANSGQDDAKWRVVVRSRDGLLHGSARVPAVDDGVTRLVHVELAAAARVELVVRDRAGALVDPASVLVRKTDGGGFQYQYNDPDPIGDAIPIEGLAPGTYEFRIHADGFERPELELELAGGDVVRREVVLDRVRSAGPISGVMRSRTGTFDQDTSLFLWEEGTGRSLVIKVEWETRGTERVGVFAEEDVPAGTYRFRPYTHGHWNWDGVPWTVTPPMAGLELTCLDDQATTDVYVHVLDARTGEPLDGFGFAWEIGDQDASFMRDAKSPLLLDAVPLDSGLRWRVSAPGFVGVICDQTDGELRGDGLHVTAELVPGWARTVRALDDATGEPLANASVIVDGVELARTGPDGRATIELEGPPAQLQIALEGYRAAEQSIADEGPTGETWMLEAELRLEREE